MSHKLATHLVFTPKEAIQVRILNILEDLYYEVEVLEGERKGLVMKVHDDTLVPIYRGNGHVKKNRKSH